MDWNELFTNPGYAFLTNKILELIDYDSIMECRKVSPTWKTYIDEQRFLRVNHLLSLMDRFLAKNQHKSFKVSSFGEKFPEWNKIIPYIKTEMSVSDMDKLIDAELYSGMDLYNGKWCPLKWAIGYENFEFVEVMIRTPFDFNSLKFTFADEVGDSEQNSFWGRCCYDEIHFSHFSNTIYSENNSVLHQAARNGDMKIIRLILKFAKEKKIDINAKNSLKQSAIVTAKDDPEVVKLLLKHCKYDKSDFGQFGVNTLACMAESFINDNEPPKKKTKIAKK